MEGRGGNDVKSWNAMNQTAPSQATPTPAPSGYYAGYRYEGYGYPPIEYQPYIPHPLHYPNAPQPDPTPALDLVLSTNKMESTKKKRKYGQTFAQRIADLQAYKEKHGHIKVSQKEDKSLCGFCNKMRYARKHPEKSTTLTDDRIASLDALGFEWSVVERESITSFAQRIADLRAYKEKHGHIKVSQKEDKSLFGFCTNMRYARKHPEKSTMTLTDDRIANLDALGFEWDLQAYKENHGHVNAKGSEDNHYCSNVCCWRGTTRGGKFCGWHSSRLVCLHEGCTQTVKEFGLCIKHDIALEEAIDEEEALTIRGGAGSPTNNDITTHTSRFCETPRRRARDVRGGETPGALEQLEGQEEQDDEEGQEEHQQYQNHQEQNQSNQSQDSRRIRENIRHNIDLQLNYLVQPTNETAPIDILQGCALVIEGTLIDQDGNNKNEEVNSMIESFGGTVVHELSDEKRKFVLSLSSKLYSLVFILTYITSSSLRNSTRIVST